MNRKLRLFKQSPLKLLKSSTYTYEVIQQIAAFIKQQCCIKPKLGIVCGSGLGSIGDIVEKATILDYKEIPNFPISSAPGHKGRLIIGFLSGVPVICMQGRFHYYEGYSMQKCVVPVRVMKLLGVTHLLVTNAAGGINPQFKVGDIMLIKDHINFLGFAGVSPLRGPNEDRFGVRFVPLTKPYDFNILKDLKEIGSSLGMADTIQEGVYAVVGGPTYETIAEVRALKILGVDAVGMSTVHEIVAARHCGITCLGFSLITNMSISDYESKFEPNSDEVLEEANKRENQLKEFVKHICHLIGTKY